MSVPALRFKDEAALDFPEWISKKIGDFVLSHKGGAPLRPSDFVKHGDFEVIPKKAISSGGYLKLDEIDPTYCTDIFFEGNQRSVVDKSFLITTLRDLVPSGPSIGFIVKFTNDKQYILAQGVYGIQIKKGLMEDFLIQYSNTDNYRELMQTMMVGSTQVHIRNSDFFQTPFCVPSFEEQTKIANFLKAVDEKISHLTQKHDLLTQYKKGVMQQIFSQELRFKDDDGRDFPEWEETSLSEIAQIVGGGTPDTSVAEYWQGNVQWFTPTEIKTKYAMSSLRTITESGLKNSSAKILPVGTLLFSSRATVGDVSIALKECTTNQGFQSMIVSDTNNNEFIYYWISNNKNAFLEKASGSTFLEISKKEIEKLPVQRPCIKEQIKIANFLTVIDDKITATQTQLHAVKQYKQGLLQQMFI